MSSERMVKGASGALHEAHQLTKLRISYCSPEKGGGRTPVTPATPLAVTPSFFARMCQDECLHQGNPNNLMWHIARMCQDECLHQGSPNNLMWHIARMRQDECLHHGNLNNLMWHIIR